jgi:hypothetical protein
MKEQTAIVYVTKAALVSQRIKPAALGLTDKRAKGYYLLAKKNPNWISIQAGNGRTYHLPKSACEVLM